MRRMAAAGPAATLCRMTDLLYKHAVPADARLGVPGADVALRDGSTIRVRPAEPEDFEAIKAFLEGLSEQSRWLRFLGAGPNLAEAARAAVTPESSVSLVAVTGAPARRRFAKIRRDPAKSHVVAHAMYVRERSDEAEIAFAVADDWQDHGIATIMLAQLADLAAAEGIHTFVAMVMPENHRMIDVFRTSGYPVDVRSGPDVIEVSFPTSVSAEGRRRFEERERAAAVAAVGHVLRPASVVVVGASRRRGTVGGEVLHNLVEGGFTGPLYAVNPHAGEIDGVPVFPTVRDLPEAVEMAVIAVPATDVVETAQACGELGVRALVILSAGFAEVGAEGIARQNELMAVCRTAGMRVLGPNCLGVLNTDPATSLNVTFAPGAAPPGRVAFASQSGAFGIAAIDLAAERSIGLSSFVSAVDPADLSGNDFLQFWEADERTDAIALYVESFGNPRKFGQIARRVSASKPVIAVKSGRTAAGRRAASSHTGAMVAASDTTVDALFAHAGVIRTDTIGEMLDVAGLLSRQPLPDGDRVAVVTNAGGPGILCADALAAQGMRVEPLEETTRRALRALLPAQASVGNPVDMSAPASAADYARVLELVLADPSVDAVVVLFVCPLATRAQDVADAIDGVACLPAAAETPLLSVYLGVDRPTAPPPGKPGVPMYATPEEAAFALGCAVRHARRRSLPPDPVPELDGLDLDAAAALVASSLGAGGGWLPPAEVEALLGAFGLPVARSRAVKTPRAAAAAAVELGGPVALKAIAPGLLHKSDIGAVRLALEGPSAVERAAHEIALTSAGRRLEGYLVQTMAPEGTELIAGVVGDPAFGPLVALGAGGRTAELIHDIQVRLAPLGRREAGEMIRGLRTFPLLDGYRGSPVADLDAVADVVLRMSALAAAHPEIAELDCNPVIAGPAGALIVDARVRIGVPPEHRPPGAVGR
jgi:acetyl coenzyme A synthetase (ADP forming)-like protein